jgi:Type II/IV secretion system protein
MVEEVFELKLPNRDWVAMQCRQPSLEGTGEIPLRRLVKEALRMRPSRIIVGEVRQAESLDLQPKTRREPAMHSCTTTSTPVATGRTRSRHTRQACQRGGEPIGRPGRHHNRRRAEEGLDYYAVGMKEPEDNEFDLIN